MFPWLGREPFPEVGVHVGGAAQRRARFEFLLTVSLGDLEDGGEAMDRAGGEAVLDQLGRTEQADRAEAVVIRREPFAEWRSRRSEDGRQELGVGVLGRQFAGVWSTGWSNVGVGDRGLTAWLL
jgi:hypothetical protein